MCDLVEVEVPRTVAALRAGRHRGQRRPVHRHRVRVLIDARWAGPTGPAHRSHRTSIQTSTPVPERNMTMTSTRPTLAVGMVGYAFMGAAHSQAWRTAPRFFDLPLTPEHGGRLRPRRRPGRRGGRPAGLGRDRDRLARAWSSATTSTSSTSARPATPTPRSPSRRSRRASTCCARSRWPTRSPRPRRWPPPPSGPPRDGVRAMVGFTYRRVPAIALARAAGRRGPDRRDPARARAVPPGLDRRPRGAAVVAAATRPRPAPARSATSARTSST